MLSKKIWLVLLCLFMPIIALACGGDEAATPSPTADSGVTPAATDPTPAPTPAPTPVLASATEVKRVVYATAILPIETNFWLGTGGNEVPQFDPFLETLLDQDVNTGATVPRLAESWEVSPDGKTWNWFLQKGVQFHFGFGEFTAKDVAYSIGVYNHEESTRPWARVFRDDMEVVDDYQLVTHTDTVFSTIPFGVSRGDALWMSSKAQFDAEGLEGIEARPSGTGAYQYLDRTLGEGITFQRTESHWRDGRADFEELEVRWVREDATRLAVLLTDAAHIADLSRTLHAEAERQGMKVISSTQPAYQLAVFFGGLYFTTGDPAFDPNVPWTDRRVRQAMNMAINREELHEVLFKGAGEPAYLMGFFSADSEGWNPEWVETFDELYGYNPDRARELLAEAGYAPGDITGIIHVYPRAEVPEMPTMLESMALSWDKVGIKMTLQDVDVGKNSAMRRSQDMAGILWTTPPSWKPSETVLRLYHTAGGSQHTFEDEHLEEKIASLIDTADPGERARLAREAADYMFEGFAEIPLWNFKMQVVVDPKVVADWKFPGNTSGAVSNFNRLKVAQ
jgi:peptide/nickel transport system substrate-binding protein